MNSRRMDMRLLGVLCGLLIAVCAYSAPVTPAQAADVARDFAGEYISSSSVRRVPARKQVTAVGGSEEQASIYVFNIGDHDGWVVVAGDDRARDMVLGYAPEGHFDYDSIPDALAWWLSEYEAQLSSLTDADTVQSPLIRRSVQVSPLIRSNWKQYAPFNDQCPTLNSSRCLAGCVAIALAQIMNYYQWPKSASGSYSYIWAQNDSTTRSGSFSSTYDWTQILKSYTSSATTAQKAEVAKLVSDIGNAIRTNYGPSASSAVPDYATGVMVSTFGYDKAMVCKHRKFYNSDDWDAILRSELDAKRPILYSGWKSTGGGHSFICDGYDTNGRFHFNFGWGSIGSSYFVSNALQNDYNSKQQITVGMQPSPASTSYNGIDGVFTSDFTASVSSGIITTWTFSYTSSPHFVTHTADKMHTKVCIENVATGAKVYSGDKTISSKGAADMYWTAASGSWTYLGGLSAGTYIAYPVCRVDNESTWHRFYFLPDHTPNALLKVTSSDKRVDGCMVETIQWATDTLYLHSSDAVMGQVAILPARATNKGLTYSSSVPTVASIAADGTITALQGGRTTLTATAQDGGGAHATCVVVVEGEDISTALPSALSECPVQTDYYTLQGWWIGTNADGLLSGVYVLREVYADGVVSRMIYIP